MLEIAGFEVLNVKFIAVGGLRWGNIAAQDRINLSYSERLDGLGFDAFEQ
jgi:hypothetical protein